MAPHRRGAGDPAMRAADDGLWRTTSTADGPASVRITVAAGEAAIGLAILVIYFRGRGTIAVDDINQMKG